jgi:hypothetical protein
MRASGSNYLSHESEKRPLGILLGVRMRLAVLKDGFPQMTHHLLNRMFPSAGRQSFLSSMSIEEFADTCQAITRWTGSVMCVTVQYFVLCAGQSLQVPEPLPHFGSAPRFSLLAGKVGART